MILKISNIRDMQQIATLSKLNIDYLAFDFCAESPRFFAQRTNAATYEIPRKIKRVGIFDSQLELHIISIAGQLGLNSIQMDGDQSPQFCEKLAAEGLEIIKTFTPDNIDQISKYEGVCNKYLLRGFESNLVCKINTQTPFLVEGNLDNFKDILNLKAQCQNLVGFDTGTNFEMQTAVKNIDQIKNLIDLRS